MDIKTKFNIGDHIHQVYLDSIAVEQDCTFCNATGIIKGADSTEAHCPKCFMTVNKGKVVHMVNKLLVNSDLKVQGINISVKFTKPRVVYFCSKLDGPPVIINRVLECNAFTKEEAEAQIAKETNNA